MVTNGGSLWGRWKRQVLDASRPRCREPDLRSSPQIHLKDDDEVDEAVTWNGTHVLRASYSEYQLHDTHPKPSFDLLVP